MPNLLNEYKSATIVNWYTKLQALEDAKSDNQMSFYLSGLFPNRAVVSEKVEWFLGKESQNVLLSASALDTDPLARNRTGLKSMEVGLSFFREEMPVREGQMMAIQQLDPKFTGPMISDIFDDFAKLVVGAFVAAEVMRAQVLTTGKITVDTNGVTKNYDYGINTLTAPTIKWNLPGTAKPIADLIGWINAQDKYNISRIIMNKYTWNLILQSDEAKEALQSPLQPTKFISSNDLKQYIMAQPDHAVEIVIYNDSYRKSVSGTLTKYIPNGMVILSVAGQLGVTDFGLTPDNFTMESDAVSISKVFPNVTVKVEPASTTPLRKRTIVTANIGVEYPMKDYVQVVTVI